MTWCSRCQNQGEYPICPICWVKAPKPKKQYESDTDIAIKSGEKERQEFLNEIERCRRVFNMD